MPQKKGAGGRKKGGSYVYFFQFFNLLYFIFQLWVEKRRAEVEARNRNLQNPKRPRNNRNQRRRRSAKMNQRRVPPMLVAEARNVKHCKTESMNWMEIVMKIWRVCWTSFSGIDKINWLQCFQNSNRCHHNLRIPKNLEVSYPQISMPDIRIGGYWVWQIRHHSFY